MDAKALAKMTVDMGGLALGLALALPLAKMLQQPAMRGAKGAEQRGHSKESNHLRPVTAGPSSRTLPAIYVVRASLVGLASAYRH